MAAQMLVRARVGVRGVWSRSVVPRVARGVTLRAVQPAVATRSMCYFNDPSANRHHSDAEARIAAVPVIEVDSKTAVCDGGGGTTGHPTEWIQLDRREGRIPETCKYCGLRYVMSENAAHGH